MKSHLIDHWVKNLKAGIYDDNHIKEASKFYSPVELKSVAQRIGVSIQNCDSCHELVHTKNTAPAYWGAQYVCHRCLNKFYRKESSGEYILRGDFGYRDRRRLEMHLAYTLQAHNANILEHTFRFMVSEDEDRIPRNKLRFFGVELELEREKDQPIPPDIIGRSIVSFREPYFTLALRDGSLSAAPGDSKKGSNGIELVSLPATMKYHRFEAGWQNFFEQNSQYFQPWPDTTGLHFHVSREGITDLTIGKITCFVNRQYNQKFMYQIAGRDFNKPSTVASMQCPDAIYAGGRPEKDKEPFESWSLGRIKELVKYKHHDPFCYLNISKEERPYYIHPDTGGIKYDNKMNRIISTLDPPKFGVAGKCTCQHKYKKDDKIKFNRYSSINVHTDKPTFEFRMFRGSTNMAHFNSSMEFCDAIIEFCTLRPLSELRYEVFIQWLDSRRKVYPYLVKWLVSSDWMVERRRKK